MAVQGDRVVDGNSAPDDLLNLEDFNDAELLRCLRLRYEREQIYTWVGSVLISVNPYRDIGVFAEGVAERYAAAARGLSLSDHVESGGRPPAGPPHLFAAVAGALASPGRLHALLISGESGAGKTEATRASLAFLARRCSAADRVRDRLLHSSHVLEAFGNAQTRQNSNSSRFGKFIEVHISSGGKLVGATLRPYMLEASRVSGSLPVKERTYHVFYYLRAALGALAALPTGAAAPTGALWHELRQAPEWQQVARVGGPVLTGSPRLEQGPTPAECLEAFEHLYVQLLGAGMSREQVADCARVVAAVSALAEGPGGAAGPPSGECLGAMLEELLGVPPEKLQDFFTNVEITVGGSARERLVRCRSDAEAKTLQSSLAQELYSALFLHVARFVARGIAPPEEAQGGKLLGLLDLYGFEVFDSNGFEQLLINYCNERIQQLFNRQVFLSEATEYANEGLDADGQWKRFASACRLPALALLEGEPGGFAGIFGVVNDRSRCGFDAGASGDGSEVVEAISAACGHHPALRRPARDAGRIFGVAHFAGEVFYEAKQFVHKNASSNRPDIVAFLRQHSSPFVKGLFAPGADGAAGSEEARTATPTASPAPGRRRLVSATLISAFRSELGELCTALEARECRHVRCLRPNDVQAPSLFDNTSMLRQCRYSGLLEATRIRRHGYAHRRSLVAFAQRYAPILTELRRTARAKGLEPPPRLSLSNGAPSLDAARPACTAIFLAMRGDGIDAGEVCAGRTKIFLKEGALDWLEASRLRAAATSMAAAARAKTARRRFLGLLRAVLRLQGRFRMRRAQREKASAAAVVLQRWWLSLRERARRPRLLPQPLPSAGQLDDERWKAIRRAAWVTDTSCGPLPLPLEPSQPASARSPPRPKTSAAAAVGKRKSPRSALAAAAGAAAATRPRPPLPAAPTPVATSGRREKENDVPKLGLGCCVGPKGKLADTARSLVSAAPAPAPRPRATSPTSRGGGGGAAGKRQALRALSPGPGSSSDRLQAQLMRVGRAVRDHEIPQDKAEMLEGFLESLLPVCAVASAPTPARAGRRERPQGERQKAGGQLQQPPWKPATVIAQPAGAAVRAGSISRCRSVVKFEMPPGSGSPSRCTSPSRQHCRRAASPLPTFGARSGTWDGRGPDVACGFSFPGPAAAALDEEEEALAHYGYPPAGRSGYAAGSSPGPSSRTASHQRAPLPHGSGRQPLSARLAGSSTPR